MPGRGRLFVCGSGCDAFDLDGEDSQGLLLGAVDAADVCQLLLTRGVRVDVRLADAFLRHDEDAPPTPLEHHDARAVGAGPLRVQAMIHLWYNVDRLNLSLEADDQYLNTEEISALLREIERMVIDLARADHTKAEALR